MKLEIPDKVGGFKQNSSGYLTYKKDNATVQFQFLDLNQEYLNTAIDFLEFFDECFKKDTDVNITLYTSESMRGSEQIIITPATEVTVNTSIDNVKSKKKFIEYLAKSIEDAEKENNSPFSLEYSGFEPDLSNADKWFTQDFVEKLKESIVIERI